MPVFPFGVNGFLLEGQNSAESRTSGAPVPKSKDPKRQIVSEAIPERFHQRDIVVIGGSAGCIGPLKSLVSSLPADLPAAIFITVHVSPEAPSILPAILSRAGQIPAVHPLDRQPIMKSTIYVAPPDHHLLIEDGCVLSSRGPRENLHRPAVDPLFRSAARSYGPRVIGIILSGLLDDGSSGLMAVKLKGGLAVVQDPAEAAFSEMPERAWHYAHAEYVLTVAGIERLIKNSVNGGAKAPRSDAARRLNTPKARKALAIETTNSNLENVPIKEHLGMPSVYACPDCHGVLWEVKEGNLLRFRCRVGHSYTAETLNVALSQGMEDALWASMRALEEKAELLRRMASRSERRAAARYTEEAERCERHAGEIREMLAENGSPHTNAVADLQTRLTFLDN
jgi:two-component system chemotaxis response regulator CheB